MRFSSSIILTTNIEIASITPAVGFNIFISSSTTKVSLAVRVALLIGRLIPTYFASISLALVS